ncbi:MAG: PEP-CTERM sorting domain-containing protein [Paucibacter sp.]|nr:PEP-CTERM sorting domain-containing protein [Roseateles sp.]
MTNSYNGTTAVTTDDVLAGVSSDTGANGLSNTSQIWRVRGQNPGNGWSSQAAIGTQGAQFAASTVGYSGITVSFDWYATTQGEGNLQLQYTTDGVNYNNVAINIGANSAAGLASLTNSTSDNTVTGAYISDNKKSNALGGQDWFQGLTATIVDPAAANDANFAIRLVNASTGADDLSTQGTALNNTSGNWRFDNVSISGIATPVPEPETYVQLLAGLAALGFVARRRKSA